MYAPPFPPSLAHEAFPISLLATYPCILADTLLFLGNVSFIHERIYACALTRAHPRERPHASAPQAAHPA
eukprot:6201522-Pleurochrysis_carterae.AAC.4